MEQLVAWLPSLAIASSVSSAAFAFRVTRYLEAGTVVALSSCRVLFHFPHREEARVLYSSFERWWEGRNECSFQSRIKTEAGLVLLAQRRQQPPTVVLVATTS